MTTLPRSIRVPEDVLLYAQKCARHEQRSVSQVLVRLLRSAIRSEVIANAACADTEGSATQKAQKNSDASPLRGGGTAAAVDDDGGVQREDGTPREGSKTPEAQSIAEVYKNVRIRRDELPLAHGTPLYYADDLGYTVTAKTVTGLFSGPYSGLFADLYTYDGLAKTLAGSDDEFVAILMLIQGAHDYPLAQSIAGPPRIRIGSGLAGGEFYDYRPQHVNLPDSWPWDRLGQSTVQNPDDRHDPPSDFQQSVDTAKEIANCPDCQAAKKHAYSDATTPGFFYTECDKHRKMLHGTDDLRTAAGMVTVTVTPVEAAKRRYPNWSPERLKELGDAESDALDATGGLLAISPELYSMMSNQSEVANENRHEPAGKESADDTPDIPQPGDPQSRENDPVPAGTPDGVSGSSTPERAPCGAQQGNPDDAKKINALKIPGVTVASTLPPPAPRKPRTPSGRDRLRTEAKHLADPPKVPHCHTCGALNGLHMKGCKEKK